MDLEHPTVTKIRKTGYPEPEPKLYGTDVLNNAVLHGDEVLCIEDIYFLVDGLDRTAIEALELLGANYAIAGK